MARVSPLCVAGRHETCQDLTYTGCLCDCHPDRPEVRVQPPLTPRSVSVPAPARPVVDPRIAARFGSWVLVVQGIVVLGLSVVTVVDRYVHPLTGGEAALGNGFQVLAGFLLLALGMPLLATGLVARGRGMVGPALGFAAHTAFTLVAVLPVAAALGPIGALELVAAEIGLGFSLALGGPWWKSADPRLSGEWRA